MYINVFLYIYLHMCVFMYIYSPETRVAIYCLGCITDQL